MLTAIVSCQNTSIRCIGMNLTGHAADGIILFDVERLTSANKTSLEHRNNKDRQLPSIVPSCEGGKVGKKDNKIRGGKRGIQVLLYEWKQENMFIPGPGCLAYLLQKTVLSTMSL